MESSGCIGSVIVAAGSSSRLGRPKQLVEIEGQPLLVRVFKAIHEGTAGPVVVVLGANENLIREKLAGLDVSIISNPEWQSGMGSSIAAGVKFLLKECEQLSGILISVCDQPLLEANHIRELVDLSKAHPDSIIASHYSDTNGPPAIFPIACLDELGELSGSRGAKHLFVKYASKLIPFAFPKGEFDLDTAQDYKKL